MAQNGAIYGITEQGDSDGKGSFRLLGEYMQEPYGRVYIEGYDRKAGAWR